MKFNRLFKSLLKEYNTIHPELSKTVNPIYSASLCYWTENGWVDSDDGEESENITHHLFTVEQMKEATGEDLEIFREFFDQHPQDSEFTVIGDTWDNKFYGEFVDLAFADLSFHCDIDQLPEESVDELNQFRGAINANKHVPGRWMLVREDDDVNDIRTWHIILDADATTINRNRILKGLEDVDTTGFEDLL